jgi:hypothetical protein
MQLEHLVLCGGLPSAAQKGVETYSLNLTGPDQNMDLRISDMRRALIANIPDTLTDLVEVAAYVYCGDGAVRRGGSTLAQMGREWRGELRFVVPVRVPEVWSSAPISRLLTETLSFLSDDFYTFEFEQLRNPPGFQNYLELEGDEPHGFQPDQVILFSGGLDSLAGTVKELIENEHCLALVSHRSAPKIVSRQRELVNSLQRRFGHHRIFYVPVWVNKDRAIGKEFTQRQGPSFMLPLVLSWLGSSVCRGYGFSKTGSLASTCPLYLTN